MTENNHNDDLVGFRPMLSAKFDPELVDAQLAALTYPLLVSPKLDGIRVVCHPTLGPVTRTLKPVRNDCIRELLSDTRLYYMDGEIIVGNHESAAYSFQATESAVMSYDGEPDFTYMVFDHFEEPFQPFEYRYDKVLYSIPSDIFRTPRDGFISPVVHTACNRSEDVATYEQEQLAKGYEGVMLRHPQMPYKFGRSTLKQQGLIKLKRFEDGEARIEGFIELERNNNIAQSDNFGLQTRSSHKSGMVPAGTLGALQVRGVGGEWDKVTFQVGSGFDANTRDLFWATRSTLVGEIICYKYQRIGSKDAPRLPIFKGLRRDLA